jgi:hypothetical protein
VRLRPRVKFLTLAVMASHPVPSYASASIAEAGGDAQQPARRGRMFARLFPRAFDNAYRGYWLAVWVLAAVSLVKTLQGINSMIMTRRVMIDADGIPLDSFAPAAAHEAMSIFALLGLNLLILPALSLVALIRYRAMIPFLYLMMIAVQLGSRLLNLLNDSTNLHAVGFFINMGLLALTVIGFMLSLAPRRDANPPRA